MDLIDSKVDEIWEKVCAMGPLLMSDWIECFSDSYCEQKLKSKLEIKKTLTEVEYQTDPAKNFLWRLISTEPRYQYRNLSGAGKRRFDLAILFLRVMTEDSSWTNFILTTLGPRHSEICSTFPNLEQQNPISCVQTAEDNSQKNTKELTISSLHMAARFENLRKVEKLIKAGKIGQFNPHGYTPLHSAAMAIHPKAEIAKLLLESVCGSQWLNKQTDKDWGQNTALHIAAANVNVTAEFIQEFKKADSLRRNSMNDTPYHVAARSSNQNAIIYMLNTFAPTNNRWDVDDVDEGSKSVKVINICARNGNAKAVSLLIKHGADISQGVLHEIVLESVTDPEKIDKLMEVYQAIVDNAVTWRCLEKETEFLKFKGSDDYVKLFRRIMIWLLTSPLPKYGGKDVLQCALDHGACAMFWRIINTRFVFRTDGEEARIWLSQTSGDCEKHDKDWYWTVYDVTNFTDETLLKPCGSATREAAVIDSSESTSPAVCDGPLTGKELDLESIVLEEDEEDQCTGDEFDKVNNKQNSSVLERNFDDLPTPERPYLTYLLTAFDQWRSTNILSTQPLKELTKPYIRLIQVLYFIFGVLHLIFMICFTVYDMPSPCSLALMFNVSATRCSSVNVNNVDNTVPSTASQERSWTRLLWLIWPVVLIIANVFITFHYVEHTTLACKQQSEKIVFKSKDLRSSLRMTILEALIQSVWSRMFCITMFVWSYAYFTSETFKWYVDVTGMVLLFGWISHLEFFGAVSKNFSIFALLVNKIVVKDFSSFMLYFGLTVVGYSFAMHALRMSSCSPSAHMDETFFSVLSSAFGIGDFFEAIITGSKCADGMQYLLEIVYFFYVCSTMIILLNVLIAMLNHRYEKAKRKAENLWRFQMLSVLRAVKSHKILVKMMKKCRLLHLPVDGDVTCDYGDENHASLFYNRELKRWYLKLVLPVDEQLEKP